MKSRILLFLFRVPYENKTISFSVCVCFNVFQEGDLNIVKLKPLIGSDWGSLLVEQGFARKMEFPAKPKYDSEDEFDGR